MKVYPYKKVDAFTSEQSQGNPAAYLWLGKERLLPEEMLRVGREHKGFVSEVVFCEEVENADIKLTYYSSECEVDFCGHGTIATMYDLIREQEELRKKTIVTFDTNRKGILKVYNRINEEDAIYITAPDPIQLEVPATKEEIAKALGTQLEHLSNQYCIDFIDAGLRTLIVPVENLMVEINLFPQIDDLKEFCESHGIDIILVYSKETSAPSYIAHTRVFAPKYGYLEDPATGSGNSAFARYLRKNQMWDGAPTKVEQGGKDICYNTVKLMMLKDTIFFGGKATVRIQGDYYL